VLISAVIIFSWLVAFGPLYKSVAYPGELQPIKMQEYNTVDCVNNVFYVHGKAVPMSDSVIAEECGGK
jgi:hypothetical protein